VTERGEGKGRRKWERRDGGSGAKGGNEMRGEGEGGRREEGGRTAEKRGLRTGEEKSQIDALNYYYLVFRLCYQ
jgi:hypothetical protein